MSLRCESVTLCVTLESCGATLSPSRTESYSVAVAGGFISTRTCSSTPVNLNGAW